MGIKLTEAGPDDPIYKRSWTFGGVNLPPSSQNGQAPQTATTPQPSAPQSAVPQEWIEQIAQEAKEQMSATAPPSDKAEE